MDKRLYPISEEFFNEKINPLIVSAYSAAGRWQERGRLIEKRLEAQQCNNAYKKS